MADPPITPPNDPSLIPDGSVPSVLATPHPALHALKTGELRLVKKQANAYKKLIWHWESLMGLHHTHFSVAASRTQSVPYARWIKKTRQARSHRLHAQAKRWMQQRTNAYLAQVRTWSKLLGTNWYNRQLLAEMTIEQRYNKAHRLYLNYEERWNASFLRRAFECIHGYEGAWTSNTGNGYYGGLQMDWPFMKRYGPEFVRKWGSADNWPVSAQIEAAVTAYRSGRGFGPWPNTAVSCGLL